MQWELSGLPADGALSCSSAAAVREAITEVLQLEARQVAVRFLADEGTAIERRRSLQGASSSGQAQGVEAAVAAESEEEARRLVLELAVAAGDGALAREL